MLPPRSAYLLAILGLASLPGNVACITCTDVGCVNSATLRVVDSAGAPVAALQGVARLEDGTALAWSCPPVSAAEPRFEVVCGGDEVVLQHFDQAIVGSTVLSAAGERADVDLAAVLEELAPNGESCGPVCAIADVDVTLAE